MNVLTNQKNKEIIWDFWQRMNYVDVKNLPALVKMKMHPEVAWYGRSRSMSNLG